MGRIDDLRAFSNSFREALIARLPELTVNGWLSIRGYEHDADGLLFILRSPNKQFRDAIRVNTDKNGLTLGIGYFHEHHDYWCFDNYEELFDHVVLKIEAIVNEELVDVTWWIDSTLRAQRFDEPPGRIDFGTKVRGLTSVQIRSWHGTYDRDVAL